MFVGVALDERGTGVLFGREFFLVVSGSVGVFLYEEIKALVKIFYMN